MVNEPLIGRLLAALPDEQVHALVERVARTLAATEAREAWPAPEPAPTAEQRARAALEAELARLEQAGAGDAFTIPAGLAPEGDAAALTAAILPPSTFAPREESADPGWRPRRAPAPLVRTMPRDGGGLLHDHAVPALLLGALLLVPRARAGEPATREALVAALGAVGDPRVGPALCLLLADARPARADDEDWMTDVERAVANHRVARLHHLALGSLPLALDDAARAELEAAAAAEVAALADELKPAIADLFVLLVTS